MKPEPSEVPRRFCSSPPLLVEELLEQLLERRARRQLRHVAQPRALLRHVLGGGDVDHRRQQLVDQVGEALAARRAPRPAAPAPVPNATAAATAAARKNPENPTRITSDLQRRSRPSRIENRPAPRVRVPVYMAAECGANKEAVMLLIYFSFFRTFAQNARGGVAGLPQRRRSSGLQPILAATSGGTARTGR